MKELLQSHRFVLVQFGSYSCTPCHAIQNRITQWNKDYPQVHYHYISIDTDPQIASSYDIYSVPTLLLFIDGTIYLKQTGYFSLDQFLDQVYRLIEKAS